MPKIYLIETPIDYHGFNNYSFYFDESKAYSELNRLIEKYKKLKLGFENEIKLIVKDV